VRLDRLDAVTPVAPLQAVSVRAGFAVACP
jgi:hypothetical protein